MFFRGSPRSFDAAARDVGDRRPGVRLAAVRDLVRHGEEHRAEVVLKLQRLVGDREPAAEVRAAAALGLADLQATEAVPALLEALSDRDAHVRQMALCGLGEIGDERAAEAVGAMLDDAAPGLRFQAIMAYPRVCRQRKLAVAALGRATEDEDPQICHLALRMAEELGPDPGSEGSVVPLALLQRARVLLEHASPEVRLASAIVVARSGEDGGDEQLVAAAAGRLRSSEGEDEAAAIELCGERGLREAVPALEQRAFGSRLSLRPDRFAWQARVALIRLGHPRAVDWVLGDLGARSRERRTLAIAAAGRARLEAARGALEQLKGRPALGHAEAVDEALAALGEREPQ
jgi:hypothetical protein